MSTSTVYRVGLSAVLVLLPACDGDSAPTMADEQSLPTLVAHDPSTHGVAGSVTLQSHPAYADVDGAGAAVRGGSVHLSVDAGGPIPRFPDSFIRSVAVFGYAWADLNTGAAIVSVIHPVIGRDSHQNPDGWHTHPVHLSNGTGTSDFCIVSIGGSQAGIRIIGDAMSLSVPAHWVPVAGTALDVAASFIVQADAGCVGSGLGVVILSAAGL